MKRRRRPAIGAATKGYRPPLKTPQLNALVDYDEDEDEPSSTEPTTMTTPQPPASGSNPLPEGSTSPKAASRSPSPTSMSLAFPPNASGPPPKRAKEEDDDNLLEALARNTRARSQSPSPSPSLGPMRPSEKRRRTEDEDDELLDRLNKSAKKPVLSNQKESAPSIGGRQKNGDDPPSKKIKVKLGAIGLAVASTPSNLVTPIVKTDTSPSTSEPSTKDGDTG